jgi:hypothetical protein
VLFSHSIVSLLPGILGVLFPIKYVHDISNDIQGLKDYKKPPMTGNGILDVLLTHMKNGDIPINR